MTRLGQQARDRQTLANTIAMRDHAWNMTHDAILALDEAHTDTQAQLAECGIAAWETELHYWTNRAAELALRAVPVPVLFTLPTWLNEAMFGPQ